jgi:hypothetical protein
LTAAKASTAFSALTISPDAKGGNYRERTSQIAFSGAQFAFDKLRNVQIPSRLPSTFDENETGTEFPTAGRTEFPNALEIPIRIRLFTKQNQSIGSGWGGRDRTSEWRNQNPLPYRLATPQ